MLKKLTSPKAKAARSSGGTKQPAEKELSGLATIPDDGAPKDKAEGGSASKAPSENPPTAAGPAAASSRKAPPSLENKTTKKRDELSLDMGALAQATASDETLQAEDNAVKGPASMDRRKNLVRSPRTKNILKDPDGAGDDGGNEAKSTPQGKKDAKLKSSAKESAAKEPPLTSPAKGEKKGKKPTKNEGLSGLKALKFSKTKKEATEISGDKHASASDLVGSEDKSGPSSAKESKFTDRKKPKDKSESKSRDEQDEETADREKKREDPQPRSDGDQKIKSSLSPLRRRKPAPEIDNQVGAGRLKEQLLGHRLKLRDLPPANQPEVHIVGEITSGEGFGSGGFACKWGVEFGSLWNHIAGDQLGQSQIDYPASGSHPIVWSHPVDLHFATTSFQGWPKLLLQVWQIDTHMKTNVVGYGFINLPFSAGEHHLTASLWRPIGSAKEEMEAKLLGRTPELVSEDVVFNSAWADRCRLQTTATGKVHLQVGVLLRNFQMSDMEM